MPKLRWKFLFALPRPLGGGADRPAAGESRRADGPGAGVRRDLNPLNGTTVALALIVLFTTPLQAAGEEYAFRGYLLQAVGSLTVARGSRSW